MAYQNGRGAFLYFRGPSGWNDRPDPEAVAQILTAPPEDARLWNIAGVDLVGKIAVVLFGAPRSSDPAYFPATASAWYTAASGGTRVSSNRLAMGTSNRKGPPRLSRPNTSAPSTHAAPAMKPS